MSFRSFLNNLLKSSSYRLIKVRPALNRRYSCKLEMGLDYILAYQLLRSDDFFFVQIGANDGVRADDINHFVRQHRLKGLVIEPLPDLFDALVENYRDCPGVVPVNAAIDRVDQTRPLYRVDPSFTTGPDWCQGIASFDKEHLLDMKRKVPGIEDHIREEEVRCLSFRTLVDEHDIRKIDLLQIDTEGYDYEIIKSIDFKALEPAIIRYEDAWLSKSDKDECMNYLMDMGYRIYAERNDVVAVKF